jgi:Bacterial SH3 domain
MRKYQQQQLPLRSNQTKMNRFLFAVFLFCSLTAQAQFDLFFAGDTTYIFGDKVNVRSSSNATAPVVDQLVMGDEVIVLANSVDSFKSATGVNMPWCEVQYGNNKKGFVWCGMLSMIGKRSLGDVKFVAGKISNTLSSTQEEGHGDEHFMMEIRATKQGRLLSSDTATFHGAGEFSMYDQPVEGALGLKGYSGLLNMSFGYPACGYTFYQWSLLWDGTNLSSLPICQSMADGGAIYYYETYLFAKSAEQEGYSGPYQYVTDEEIFLSIESFMMEELEDGSGSDATTKTWVRRMVKEGNSWKRPDLSFLAENQD